MHVNCIHEHVFYASEGMPIKVGLRFPDDIFPDICRGENMVICRDGIIGEITNTTKVDKDRLTQLKLETG